MDIHAPADSTGQSVGGGRYVLKRLLGAGAMGQVFVAFDTELGCDVAVKMLRGRSADDLYYLKYEFRALADLRHPNLVTLHDLVIEPPCPFFTMELLSGVDLVAHVRGLESAPVPGPPGSGGWDRLRSALPQLLAGLAALHASGRLHRDIKAGNILVAGAGRVVLIDFGLATLPAITPETEEPALGGTLAYMAPELLRGASPTVASDCYALGVTLFEALTGELPPGPRTVKDVLRGYARGPTPSARARVPETPEDLDALVTALLKAEPAERPDHGAIRSMLRAQTWPGQLLPSTASLWQAPFVDRAESLAMLDAALREVDGGKPVMVRLEGPSGIGKSALVRHFLSRLGDRPTVVLAGRCYPQESVPFKALDGLVDGLSETLGSLPAADLGDLTPDAVAAVLRLFPVLGRVPGLAALPPADLSGAEPDEIRRLAFATLRDVLRRVTERKRLVLWIDDLQWGDADSAVFLRLLAHPRDAPPLFVLLSYRSAEWEASTVARALEDANGRPIGRTITLDSLPQDAARSLATALLTHQDDAAGISIDEILRESAGNPFLVCEIARYCAVYGERRSGPASPIDGGSRPPEIPVGINEIVAHRIRDLDPVTRRLLSAVAVSGGPCRRSVASRAVDLEHGLNAAVTTLRNECLLRHSTQGNDLLLETFHDRIREAILELLDGAERRRLHLGLAAALEREPDTDPIILVEHYHGAGDDARAARTATRAAERAFDALAFEQAARLYDFALRVGHDETARWRLLRGRAEALAQAGQGGAAGPAFLEAARLLGAEDPGSRAVPELRRLAAEQFLRSGYIGEGTNALREVLRAVGEPYPKTPGRAVLDFGRHRLLLLVRGLGYRPQPEAAVPLEELRRIDALWSAAVGLVWADSIRSAAFHGRHTRRALNAGEPTRVVRALCTEAVFHAAIAGRWAQRRSRRALESAIALSAQLGSPQAIGLTEVCAGGAAYFAGRFSEAQEHSVRAEEILRTRCTGVAWELTNAHIFRCWSLAHMGDLDALHAVIPELLQRARERGDLLAYCCLLGGIPTSMRLLAEDKPEEARAAAREAVSKWPARDFQVPNYFALVSATLADLYAGRSTEAWTGLNQIWPTVQAVRLLDFQLVRVELLQLRARCALVALANGDAMPARARHAMRRLVRRTVPAIKRVDMPWAAPLADALLASIAAASGERSTTNRLLHRAAAGFAAADMQLWAAVARHQAGAGDGADWMRRRGIKDPDRYAETLIPIRTVTGC